MSKAVIDWVRAIAETYKEPSLNPVAFSKLVGLGAEAIIGGYADAAETSADPVTVDFNEAEEGPWFVGHLCGDDEDHQVISIGPYSLDDRPNQDHHYEDTICEVWDNGNLVGDAEATARLIAAAPALATENARMRAETVRVDDLMDMAKSYTLGSPESRAIVTAIEHARIKIAKAE